MYLEPKKLWSAFSLYFSSKPRPEISHLEHEKAFAPIPRVEVVQDMFGLLKTDMVED